MAYTKRKAVFFITEAERFTHYLTLLYAVLSGDCKNEAEYLDKAEQLSKELMQADTYDLDDLFFGNPPKRKQLNRTLRVIINNIKEVRKIPEDKRHYEF